MIADRIRRHKVLLPINQNYDKIRERNKTSDMRFYIKKKNKQTKEKKNIS